MDDFSDKVGVITGAASGIGRSLAEYGAGAGMKLVLADVEAEPLFSLASEMKAGGIDVTAVVTDVSKVEDVRDLVRKTTDAYGRADLLFNNAGVAGGGALWEGTLNDCRWIINVNLWGTIFCIREFVPLMIGQKTPCHIVNMASMAGVITYHPSSLYHLTKHGVVALSEQLHHDFTIRGLPINVSVACPGFVNTRLIDAERNRPADLMNDPAGAPGMPEDDEMAAAFRKLLADGMPPATVADIVFRAIRGEQFYIFTHPEVIALIQSRMTDMLEGRNPVLPPPPEVNS